MFSIIIMTLEAVIIDNREPTWIQGLKFGGVPVITSILEAGDIQAMCSDGESILVERKTTSDYLGSIHDNRVFAQVANMRETTPWVYVIIAGELKRGRKGTTICEGRETDWNWGAVVGAGITLQEMGAVVLFLDSDAEFEDTVLRIGARDRGVVRVMPNRLSVPVSASEAILAALPGIGAERAGALLAYAGTPAAALQYLTDPSIKLDKVPGIGAGTRAKVRSAMGLLDNEVVLEGFSR